MARNTLLSQLQQQQQGFRTLINFQTFLVGVAQMQAQIALMARQNLVHVYSNKLVYNLLIGCRDWHPLHLLKPVVMATYILLWLYFRGYISYVLESTAFSRKFTEALQKVKNTQEKLNKKVHLITACLSSIRIGFTFAFTFIRLVWI